MSRVTRIVIAASLFTFATACSSVQSADAGLRANTAFSPEASTTWARPTEVGYDFTGQEIEGKASSTSILFGLISFGASDTSLLSSIIGLIRGGGTDTAIARAAAYDAMSKAENVDGIYVTRQTGSSFSFIGLYRSEEVTVRGKALRLRVIGEVSQDRADKERFLRALPAGTMTSSGLGGPIGNIIQQLLAPPQPAL